MVNNQVTNSKAKDKNRALFWEYKIAQHNYKIQNNGGIVSDDDELERKEIKQYLDRHCKKIGP